MKEKIKRQNIRRIEKGKTIVIGETNLTKNKALSLLMARPADDLFYLLGGDWQLKNDSSQIKGYTIFKARSPKIEPLRLYKTSNYQKTIRIGRKIYKDLSLRMYKRICIDWELCKKIKNFHDNSTLIFAVAALLGGITNQTINTLIVATILFKKRFNKFCKCT